MNNKESAHLPLLQLLRGLWGATVDVCRSLLVSLTLSAQPRTLIMSLCCMILDSRYLATGQFSYQVLVKHHENNLGLNVLFRCFSLPKQWNKSKKPMFSWQAERMLGMVGQPMVPNGPAGAGRDRLEVDLQYVKSSKHPPDEN